MGPTITQCPPASLRTWAGRTGGFPVTVQCGVLLAAPASAVSHDQSTVQTNYRLLFCGETNAGRSVSGLNASDGLSHSLSCISTRAKKTKKHEPLISFRALITADRLNLRSDR